MNLLESTNLFLGEYSNPGTQRAYRAILEPLVLYMGSGWDVTEVTPAMVRKYAQDLKAGKVRRGKDDFVQLDSPHSVYKHLKAIKRFFNFLIEIEELEKSPAKSLPNPRPHIKQKRAATPTEMNRLIMAAYGHTRNYAIVRFLVDTGCRSIGVVNLQMQDLDLENCEAVVYEKFNTDRSREGRPVWFTYETAQAIREWLVERQHTEHQYVFTSSIGGPEPLTSEAVAAVVSRLSIRARIKQPFHPHAIRRGVGHELAKRVPVTITALVLGHKDTKITLDHYYPADPKQAEEAMRLLHEDRHKAVSQSIIKPFPSKKKVVE